MNVTIIPDDLWVDPPTQSDAWQRGSLMCRWVFSSPGLLPHRPKWSLAYQGTHLVIGDESVMWIDQSICCPVKGLIQLSKGVRCVWSGCIVIEPVTDQRTLFVYGLSLIGRDGHVSERRSVDSKIKLLHRVDLDGVFESIANGFSITPPVKR